MIPEPYWQSETDGEPDGRAVLYCGDCLEILPLLAAGSVECVVSDPPYGIDYIRGEARLGIHSKKSQANKHAGVAIVGDDSPFDPTPWLSFPSVLFWGADHFAGKLPHGRFLAWDKLAGKKSWDSFSDVEFAWHNKRGASRIISYCWKGLCQGAGEDKGTIRYHPTAKPVIVMRWSVYQASVNEAGVVMDPYMGSGTTGVACARLGRRFIGIEIDEGYCETAKKRIITAMGGTVEGLPEGSLLFPEAAK